MGIYYYCVRFFAKRKITMLYIFINYDCPTRAIQPIATLRCAKINMTMNRRMIIASLVAPIAILLIPIVGSILVAFGFIATTSDPMDDAPVRSAGIFLFVLAPLAYPFLAVIVFLTTWLLGKIHLLSKQSLTAIVVALAVALGIFLGLQSQFGVKDQLIGIGVFTSLITICLGLGAIAWWLIAGKGTTSR